jgi:glycosyltransferase involved in cell wall biosynthesis
VVQRRRRVAAFDCGPNVRETIEIPMARVLVIANDSWNIQHFRAGLIRALLDHGHEVTTVSPEPSGVAIDDRPLPHRTWRMSRSGTNPFRELADIARLAAILAGERPDLVLGFTIKPNIYACGLSRLLGIAAAPNVTGLGTAFLGGSGFRRLVVLLYRFAFARARTVFFQNPDDQDLFVREGIVGQSRSRVLPGSGIDLSRFPPAELPGEVRFLMIARLLGDKGVREYAEAARQLKAKLPGARFALLGELDRDNRTAIGKHELDEWIEEGIIDYLGATSDVRPFIADSTALVLPSYREGLPRTLLEGAVMARPLIGADVPGCRELVRDGLTGFLCQPRDAPSLAAAMERLAESSQEVRVRMGQQARAMAEREFDEQHVLAAYLELLQPVA